MTLQKDPEGFEKKILHKYVDFGNQRVLEIGCGEGRLTWKYASASDMTVGIDLDQDALRIAQADSLELHGHVQFTRASAKYIPFSNNTFDIAILAWSL